jgi:DNA-binding MarR family transcriptional regulator
MSPRAAGALEVVPPLLGEVLDFLRVIWALDHALQKRSRRTRSVLGVTGPQRLVIRLIARFPGIPAGHLAQLLHVHPSTLTGILKRLERQGLVKRSLDARDRRRHFLGVTPEGRRIDAVTEGTVESALAETLARLPADRVAHARAVLLAIAEALDETGPSRG